MVAFRPFYAELLHLDKQPIILATAIRQRGVQFLAY